MFVWWMISLSSCRLQIAVGLASFHILRYESFGNTTRVLYKPAIEWFWFACTWLCCPAPSSQSTYLSFLGRRPEQTFTKVVWTSIFIKVTRIFVFTYSLATKTSPSVWLAGSRTPSPPSPSHSSDCRICPAIPTSGPPNRTVWGYLMLP